MLVVYAKAETMETSHMKEQSTGENFASFADDDEWVEATPVVTATAVVTVGNGGGGGANWAAFGTSDPDDYTEWQSFAQPSVNTGSQNRVAPIEARHDAAKGSGPSPSVSELSASLLKECFHTNHTLSTIEHAQVPGLTVDERLWTQLTTEASSYRLPSCPVVNGMINDTLFPEGDKHVAELSLLDCPDVFEWNIVESPTESFDLSPGIFRPRVDIPTDMEIDRAKAVLALRGLHIDDLELMHEDLAAKCKRDFEDLIAQLEERDILVQDMEVRNKFIAAHVRVQNMRHSQEQAATKHKAKARDDHVPTGKFLRSIVPYNPPESHVWKTDTLQLLTALLEAIADDSTEVPQLLSDYLQSEVLSGMPPAVHHESPVKAYSLSSLSLASS
eukprot:Em0019g684a